MIRVWPRGCVCQAVRAPGSKVTWPAPVRAGSGAWNSGSTRTDPVNQSAEPLADGREPFRLISISISAIPPFLMDLWAETLPLIISISVAAPPPITVRREYVSTIYDRGRFSITSLTTGAAENALGQPA